MIIVIVRKAFKNWDKPDLGPLVYYSNLYKFLLKVFNRLLYNYEVSRLLVVRFLLDLLDYYTFNTFIKLINISMLKIKFLLLISKQNFNINNDIINVNDGKI